DRQTETGAAAVARAAGRYAVEALGNARQVLRGDARSIVLDLKDARTGVVDRPADADVPTRLRVADGVAHEVSECALRFLDRSAQVARGSDRGGDGVSALAQGLGIALQCGEQCAYVHRIALQTFERFQPRQREQVLHDARH